MTAEFALIVNKEVRSESCYIAHKLEKKRKGTNIMLPSLCEQNWQCKECGISLKRNEKEYHECGEITCHNCGHNYMSNEQHLCYMRSFTSDLNPDKFIFMTLSAHRQMVNTGLTLLWPIAFAMNVKITLSQLRLHVKTVVLDVLYVTNSMSKEKEFERSL